MKYQVGVIPSNETVRPKQKPEKTYLSTEHPKFKKKVCFTG
jgi:hypothetical protein